MEVHTKVWKVVDREAIREAAGLLGRDQVVAFPTETVYGLGVNAYSTAGVEKVFAAKGRPSDNPLIVHIGDIKDVDFLVREVPHNARLLMERLWPGPLSLILWNAPNTSISSLVTAGLDTVALRMPNHPVALELIRTCGKPLAAPSANVSGKPSPTLAEHVLDDLDGKISGVLDGGPCDIGIESTVIDCVTIPNRLVICRPGGVTLSQVEDIVGKGNVIYDDRKMDENVKPIAPGMKYKHYSPEAALWLISSFDSKVNETIEALLSEGKKVGVLATDQGLLNLSENLKNQVTSFQCGTRGDSFSNSHHLYEGLRYFDKLENPVDVILCEQFSSSEKLGLEAGIMNRLYKAASQQL